VEAGASRILRIEAGRLGVRVRVRARVRVRV